MVSNPGRRSNQLFITSTSIPFVLPTPSLIFLTPRYLRIFPLTVHPKATNWFSYEWQKTITVHQGCVQDSTDTHFNYRYHFIHILLGRKLNLCLWTHPPPTSSSCFLSTSEKKKKRKKTKSCLFYHIRNIVLLYLLFMCTMLMRAFSCKLSRWCCYTDWYIRLVQK